MAESYQMKVETPAAIEAQAEPLRVVEAVSPTAVVEATGDGARITIHDLHGTTTAQVYNGKPGAAGPAGPQGEQGERGPKGETGAPGRDGVSPTAAVTKTATGAVLTVTDAEGTTTAEISNGQDGAPGAPGTDGVSPTISITDITGGHRVTITDATGAHSFDVMDGDAADAPVQDVQVNGTSVLSNGVANVPVGNTTQYGAVKLQAYGGLQIGSTNLLKTDPASESVVKSGTDAARPIVPGRQHVSAFYGLAKAAGDTTQSTSSNAVGTYTDAAKIAIQKMLGIYEAPWELIREDTFTNETEADYEIAVDSLGQSFELTDTILLFETPKQATASGKGLYGMIYFYYDGNTNNPLIAECGAWTQDANANAHGCMVEVRQEDFLVLTKGGRQATTSNYNTLASRYAAGLNSQKNGVFRNTAYPTKIKIERISIRSVTGTGHFILYGKRA